jgi:NodT family efflux transporter outer membrane factor (OMF) lipoprotein
MRSQLGVLLTAVVATSCLRPPPYQPPTVVVAPEFRAVRDSTLNAVADSGHDAVTVSVGGSSPAPLADSQGVRLALGDAGGSGPVLPVAAPPVADRVDGVVHISTEAPDSPFWLELGDSALVALVREALKKNPDVHVAESRLRATRASRKLSAFDFAPTVTASAGVSRQRISVAQLPGLSVQPSQQDLWDGGFDASWELDVFGRITQNVRAQGAFVQSAEEDLQDVQLSLAAEVARTYFELRGAQSELEVARRNAENQRRTLALTRERLDAGRGTAFDTERAKAELSLTLAATPEIEARIAASKYRIAVLLGRSPGELPSALAESGGLPPLPDVVHVGSPKQLVRHRPDVISAERQLAARSMLVSAAEREYLPRFSIGASAGYTSSSLDGLGNTGTSRYIVGPVISWPFLNLGRVGTRAEGAEAEADAARARYESAVLGAVEEAETSIVTYRHARARLSDLSDAVKASTHALELAQLRFQEGVTDFLQVLDAQRTLLSAENQLAVGRTAAATSLVAVYKAVGGGMRGR